MLLADQRRTQHVVDPAVEDHDVLAADRLAVDDARDVGAGGADEEAAGLEQDPRVAAWPASPASRSRERGRGRSPRPARSSGSSCARTGSRARRPHRRAGAGSRPRSRGRAPPSTVASTWAGERRGVEDVRGAERVQADGLEPGRRDGLRRGDPQVRARPSRTCRRRRRRPAGRARGAPPPRRRRGAGPAGGGRAPRRSRASRRSSPTDSTVTARTPASTAAASSSSRLPGPVTTIAVRLRRRPGARAAAPRPRRRPRRGPSRARWRTTARLGLALTRVREVDGGRQRATEAPRPGG